MRGVIQEVRLKETKTINCGNASTNALLTLALDHDCVDLQLDEGLQLLYFSTTYIKFATVSEWTVLWYCVLWGLSTHPCCPLFILPFHVSNTLEHLICVLLLHHLLPCQVML